MENASSTLGLEDGAIDVERLLVEPQDGHVSVDSVIYFNKKIPQNAMDLSDVSFSFGGSDTDIAQEGGDVINGEVLNAMPSEVEVGYFRYHNDFCGMGEEYLLGVEFAESITNLDYGSCETLQAQAPDSHFQVSSAASDTTCRSDLFRKIDVPDSQNDRFNIRSCELSDVPSSHECEMLVEEKPSISPRLHTSQNIGDFHNSSICSFQDILPDENDGRLSPASKMSCTPKTEKVNEVKLTGQDGQTDIIQGQEEAATMSVQSSCTDVLPTQKRSRKPTQRYIDELTDPMPAYSKRRREVSSSTHKVKSPGSKDHKKCHMGSKAIKLPAEESSVKAIQVPFASLAHNECPESNACEMLQNVDGRNLMPKSKGRRVTPESQKKKDECVPAINVKKRDVGALIPKKRDDSVNASHLKKRDAHITGASLKKRTDCIFAVSPKKKDDPYRAASQNKRDDSPTAAHQNKRDDCLTFESPEEVSVRRKHHRLWTIAEVRKLIDGVSQYGVGRWSRIKKLFFSTSAHRTSVDLKDKWRNLLKASGIQEPGNGQGEKKRAMAWRPLPKSILRRVCELAAIYPYPKGQRLKVSHMNDDSPDRTADITLSDYRRILRSINGN